MKKLLLSFFFLCFTIAIYSQMYINDQQDYLRESPLSVEDVEMELINHDGYAKTFNAFDIYIKLVSYQEKMYNQKVLDKRF